MKLVGLFVIGWFIVAFLVALAAGGFIRSAAKLDNPSTPSRVKRRRPERRIKIRRAKDRGAESHSDLNKPDRRHGVGRRSEDRV
ncbi:MAG: hypothetical protein GTO41_27465 [Burkholderiales bacterium]|nr:hypothetical protein [Burkholderiales bacterium]